MIVFLDNILIYSASKEDNFKHLMKVFDLLHSHKLYGKQSKCEFLKTKLFYLGHVISAQGVQMDMTRVNAIMHWPHPTNLVELQNFLGLAGFYRKYVHNYARIAIPLIDQLKFKGKHFNWQ